MLRTQSREANHGAQVSLCNMKRTIRWERFFSVFFKTANLELPVQFIGRHSYLPNNKSFTANVCLSREKAATYNNEMLLTRIRPAKTERKTAGTIESINIEQKLGFYVCTLALFIYQERGYMISSGFEKDPQVKKG